MHEIIFFACDTSTFLKEKSIEHACDFQLKPSDHVASFIPNDASLRWALICAAKAFLLENLLCQL